MLLLINPCILNYLFMEDPNTGWDRRVSDSGKSFWSVADVYLSMQTLKICSLMFTLTGKHQHQAKNIFHHQILSHPS